MSSFNQKWDSAEKLLPADVIFHKMAPTLEDLVEECQKKYCKKTPLQLFSLMRCQISSLYCDNFLNAQTMKELWLLYYMNTIHHKKWNEDKKTWESE